MNQKLKQWQIDKYQDIYKMAWDRQNKIDRKENPKIMPSPQAKNGQDAGKFGKMGGAPKLALSENAKYQKLLIFSGSRIKQ